MLNQQIGQYKIISKLGEGGMAVVYLAEKGVLRKQVALKMLHEDFLSNRNIRGRFLSEAKKMINLNHPNIVGVQDLIDDGDFVAIELEYIDGKTLKQHLHEKGALPDDEIQYLFKQMLDAISFVHEKGYVHRDIKPSNFMLSKNGIIKLTDFGIAKNGDDTNIDYTGTGTGMQMGTPKYMSPEQVRNTKDVDYRSDIYSLGVVLWEMVTGKVPYDIETESTFDVFRKIVDEPLEPTDTRWDKVIEKCTNKNIEYRYQKVDEIKIESTFDVFEKIVHQDLAHTGTRWDAVIKKATLKEVGKRKLNLDFGTKEKNKKRLLVFTKNQKSILWIFAVLLLYGIVYWAQDDTTEELVLAEEKIAEKKLIEDENKTSGTFIDSRDNKTYKTIKIGNQVWMAENLAYEPSSGNYWAYDNNSSNIAKYGYLYDWETACKVCPNGWHLPSDAEWTRLTDYLGGAHVAGKKMKSSSGWRDNGNGSNASGFSGLPGGNRYTGNRYTNGSFYIIGYTGFWWCSTEDDSNYAWTRILGSDSGTVYRSYYYKESGFSVRCLRD